MALDLASFVNWTGWTWAGWHAIAALAPLVSGIGTIGSLIYLSRQFRLQRRVTAQDLHYRRADFQRAHSPVLSVEPRQVLRSSSSMLTMLHVHATGTGTAYSLQFHWECDSPHRYVSQTVLPSLRAGEKVPAELAWPSDLLPALPIPVRLRLTYTNSFRQAIMVTYDATLAPAGLDLAGPPYYEWPSDWFQFDEALAAHRR
jgi:hypothetical protein